MSGKHPKSFEGAKCKRGLLFRLVSPLLFFAPEVNLAAFEDIFVDEVIRNRTWKVFASNMVDGFSDYITYATILLNANVVYLAIPSVQGPSSSVASMVSMMSMITSLGSIVAGLLLMRWRKTGGEYAEEVCNYLYPKKGSLSRVRRRTEKLAVLYSLPYALLLWA